MSFQEELHKNMQRSASGIPVLEELAKSGNIDDHFLAFVYTTNMAGCKNMSENFFEKSNKSVVEPDIALTKTKLEFLSSLEQGGETKQVELQAQLLLPRTPSIGLTKRSKSCNSFPTSEVFYPSVESSEGVEEKESNYKCGMFKEFPYHRGIRCLHQKIEVVLDTADGVW